MRLFTLTMAALLIAGQASANCGDPVEVTSSTADYVNVGVADAVYSISFEPDATGSATTATITLQFCSREAADSCQDYDFDSDGDGIADTNILDGSKVEKSGVKGIQGFKYLLVSVGTSPGAGEVPEYTVCATRMK